MSHAAMLLNLSAAEAFQECHTSATATYGDMICVLLKAAHSDKIDGDPLKHFNSFGSIQRQSRAPTPMQTKRGNPNHLVRSKALCHTRYPPSGLTCEVLFAVLNRLVKRRRIGKSRNYCTLLSSAGHF
jgi:hypothetical protein